MKERLTREQVELRCKYFRDMGHCHVYSEDILAHDAAMREELARINADLEAQRTATYQAVCSRSAAKAHLAAALAREKGLKDQLAQLLAHIIPHFDNEALAEIAAALTEAGGEGDK